MAKRIDIARELSQLPVGIHVHFSPCPVHGQLVFGRDAWNFIWQFSTTVQVTAPCPLAIAKFGVAVRRGRRWVYSSRHKPRAGDGCPPTRTVRSPDDFARQFGCPSGRLEPGVAYTAADNWTESSKQRASRQRWWFIGKDDEGRRFRGEGELELQAWAVVGFGACLGGGRAIAR